jgi:N-methylhydantoinase A
MIIGVDTGGTFTDLALFCDAGIITEKVPSSPPDFSAAIMDGIARLLHRAASEELAAVGARFDLVHSSTVATNALLERQGANTALVTTEGFRDVLEIGRQTRPSLYDLHPRRNPPLVPRSKRFEIAERIGPRGDIILPIKSKQIQLLAHKLAGMKIESAAVCLLFSFANPKHEKMIGDALSRLGIDVSLSCEISPEFREFERTATTVVNAYVAPVMKNYLGRLAHAAKNTGADKIRIVTSNGGSLSPAAAGERAATTLLSGPAAGVAGACSLATQALGASPRIITFDMGGTSTDVALIEGRPGLTTEMTINDLPIRLPMIDIHTVGAGGGSLATIDAGSALGVGPRSAGASPGPACYGHGTKATVTDANLILGRLLPDHFLGGRMKLDVGRAKTAIDSLAREMGCSIKEAAVAIIRVVNSNMERAIRVISTERGHDPREFTLVSFGGAGGLHACDLADALEIPRVLIPRNPGVLSAWGALSSDVVFDYSTTVMLCEKKGVSSELKTIFAELKKKAARQLGKEGFTGKRARFEKLLELRYRGQSYELQVPFANSLIGAFTAFDEAHYNRYGHSSPEEAKEIVTVRLTARGLTDKPELERIEVGGPDAGAAIIRKKGRIVFVERTALAANNQFSGPALIVEDFSTTWMPEGWQCRADIRGNLHLER